MIPLIPDTGLAPCQEPPLLVGKNDVLLLANPGAEAFPCGNATWEDLHGSFPKLIAGGKAARLSSPRALDVLRRARQRGNNPAQAVGKWWHLSLSPARAAREWRRWQMVSAPLEIPCLLLTTGFFIGLPVMFLYSGILPALITAACLWLIMIFIAARLWWIGSKVYPTVKSQFRMDAMLSLLVPFHAMRASEIASVHAMAGTHAAALILSSGQTDNSWLARLARELLFPLPDSPQDQARNAMMRPSFETSLARLGKNLSGYDIAPSREDDPDATSYCPRCHGFFGPGITVCPDCRGLPLRSFS